MRAFVALLAVTLSATGVVGPDSPESAPEPIAPVNSEFLDMSVVPFRACSDDKSCGASEHKMQEGTQFEYDAHDCIEPSEHSGPACGVSFNPNDVLTAGATRLAAMLTASGTNVYLNVERQAIQVRGCSGSIIAHLPLKDGAMAAIRSAL